MKKPEVFWEEKSILLKDDYLNSVPSVEKALEYALDIRKIEIELYWKRATYFWAFLAVAIGGYSAITIANGPLNHLYLFIVSCVGLTFALSWWKVNEGSKIWQDNWEKQVDLLENEVIGPLYKTLIIKKDTKKFYSVSKINLNLSKYIFLIWLLIAGFHGYFFLKDKLSGMQLIWLIIPIIIIFMYFLKDIFYFAKTFNEKIKVFCKVLKEIGLKFKNKEKPKRYYLKQFLKMILKMLNTERFLVTALSLFGIIFFIYYIRSGVQSNDYSVLGFYIFGLISLYYCFKILFLSVNSSYRFIEEKENESRKNEEKTVDWNQSTSEDYVIYERKIAPNQQELTSSNAKNFVKNQATEEDIVEFEKLLDDRRQHLSEQK
ncbi:RipA family octameric membrane protein [Shouchella miscanthi]|uniref:RipA family octameric membrane protein n=1 Tax=Shouchella miscanthi TaxID=2598861 RepID=UPI0011AB1E52|nr:hypothetical protein [Shouchella miscanthi]